MQIRKLVYLYVAHYAEAQPDIALLSISSFQKALKDPNQLVRACALRVLCNIRIPVIVPIVLIALKQARNGHRGRGQGTTNAQRAQPHR